MSARRNSHRATERPLQGMWPDPIRRGVADAILAGVRVVMLTGDHAYVSGPPTRSAST